MSAKVLSWRRRGRRRQLEQSVWSSGGRAGWSEGERDARAREKGEAQQAVES